MCGPILLRWDSDMDIASTFIVDTNAADEHAVPLLITLSIFSYVQIW